MKKLVLLLAVIALASCSASKNVQKEKNEMSVETISKSQKMEVGALNKIVPYKNSTMILGKANRNGLEMQPFKDWFDKGYNNYKVDSEIVQS